MKLRHLPAVFAFFLATGASAADPQLLKLIMPDAKVVSGIDVDHVKGSPFGQFLLSQFLGEAGFKEIVGATGFDPRRDVHEVVMASPGDPQKKSALLIVRGTFDAPRIVTLLQASGMKSETYNGVLMFSGMGGVSQAVAFLDNSVVVNGDPISVRGAIDRRSTASALGVELLNKISQTSANKDAWIVSLAPVSAFAAVAPDRTVRGALQGDLFKAIEQSSGGVRFGTVIEISGELTSRSSADASSLADVLKFLLSMAQTNAPAGQAAQFAALLKNLTVSAESNAVKLSGAIPEIDLETALRPASRQLRGQTPRI